MTRVRENCMMVLSNTGHDDEAVSSGTILGGGLFYLKMFKEDCS